MKKGYVGVDVSKHKLDIAFTTDGDTFLNEITVKNTVKGCKNLIEYVEEWEQKNNCKIHVGLEATGKYSKKALEGLYKRDIQVSHLNPTQVHYFSKTKMLRTKTDQVDSRLIAQYCQTMTPPEYTPRDVAKDQLRELVRHRDYLIEQQAHQKTYLESVEDV